MVKKFKQALGKVLFAMMAFNSITPVLLAAPAVMQKQPEMMATNQDGIDTLIMEMVSKAQAMDMDCLTPSPALMRCYERIVNGHKTMLVSDVMEAMPELLSFAIAKYEKNVTRSSRPGEATKAPRPNAQNPYAPGAVVGSILVDPNAGCAAKDVSGDLCEIINLLLIIKKQIGTVEDDVCCDSVLGVLGDACNILGMSISDFLLTLSFNYTFSNCCEEIIETITACCSSLHCEIEELKCMLDCRLGDFNDCCDCDCDDCDASCGGVTRACDLCDDSDDCCSTFDNVSQGLSEIYCEVASCCELTNSNFVVTWSLIEECCQATQSAIEECCELTESLLVEILDTLTQCCDDLADDIFDTQAIIIECCEQTQSNFEATWSLIEACCQQTQSNFEITWSLIENLVASTSSDLTQIYTTLEACCEQTQSSFIATWSLLGLLEDELEACCSQIQNNFETTWSLLENFEVSVSIDFTEIFSALEECCERNQANFETTWSLIDNSTAINIAGFTTVINEVADCCLETNSNIAASAAANEENFETTWSLINALGVSSDACCLATQSAVDACCEQTQSNFVTTWSMIENSNEVNIEGFTAVIEILTNCCEQTLSNIAVSAQANETNFVNTWSLIGLFENEFEACCAQTQSNFEFTWSLINNINVTPFPPVANPLLGLELTVAGDITVPGLYKLSSNVAGAINILVGDVTLDLNGFNITNLVGDAITVGAVANVTIQNGTCSAPNHTAINVGAAINLAVSNVNCVGSTIGLAASNAVNVVLTDCVFHSGGQALVLGNVSTGAIRGCQLLLNTAVGGQAVVALSNVANITVIDSIITQNNCSSVPLLNINNSNGLKFINTLVNNNNSTGGVFQAVALFNSVNCVFNSCEISQNQGTSDVRGVELVNCNGVQLLGCTVFKNATTNALSTLIGVHVVGTSNNCSILDCVSSEHINGTLSTRGVGIQVDAGSTNCTIARNSILHNSTSGVVIELGAGATVINNVASSNGFLPSVSNFVNVPAGLINTLLGGVLSLLGNSSFANLSTDTLIP